MLRKLRLPGEEAEPVVAAPGERTEPVEPARTAPEPEGVQLGDERLDLPAVGDLDAVLRLRGDTGRMDDNPCDLRRVDRVEPGEGLSVPDARRDAEGQKQREQRENQPFFGEVRVPPGS